MRCQAALFDADGVLTLPEEFFATMYARSHGLDEALFEPFFQNKFRLCSIGQADLKQLILEEKELWATDNPDALLKQWFEAENVRNEELLSYIQQLRQQGLPVFIASVQEQYRAQYFKDIMFKNEFDGFYFSYQLGLAKPNPKFFEAILADLRATGIATEPDTVFFTDDREKNVASARSVGFDAHLYQGVDGIKQYFDSGS